ncbi:hypothetical protein, partial [Reichenbachiella sp.]
HQMIIRPRENEYNDRRPSNFVWWTIGIYVGLFGIAFQNYEKNLNRLYLSFSAYVEQMGGDEISNETLQGFIDLQLTPIPCEVDFWAPSTIYKSFKRKYNTRNARIASFVSDMMSSYMKKVKSINVLYIPERPTLRLKNESVGIRISELDFVYCDTRELNFGLVIVNYLELEADDVELSNTGIGWGEITANNFNAYDSCLGSAYIKSDTINLHDVILNGTKIRTSSLSNYQGILESFTTGDVIGSVEITLFNDKIRIDTAFNNVGIADLEIQSKGFYDTLRMAFDARYNQRWHELR